MLFCLRKLTHLKLLSVDSWWVKCGDDFLGNTSFQAIFTKVFGARKKKLGNSATALSNKFTLQTIAFVYMVVEKALMGYNLQDWAIDQMVNNNSPAYTYGEAKVCARV